MSNCYYVCRKEIMIERINTISVNSGKRPSQKQNQPQFKGLDTAALGLIQACEKSPMVNVTVLDLSTAIVPRTVVESETNPYAGLEAFRRESSGLVINCLIPGAIVLGIAKLIEKPIMGGNTKMGSCWADEDTITLITKHWSDSSVSDKEVKYGGKIVYEKGSEKAKVYNTIKSILDEAEGVDGTQMKAFKGEDFHNSIVTLTEKSFVDAKYTKADKKAISDAYKAIAKKTHATENIKFDRGAKEFFSQNLESVINGTPRILRELVGGKTPDVSSFAVRAKRLLTYKSLAGLGVIIPLAISAQPINRWITAKTSGIKGAPIYKDFGENGNKELSPEEKSALAKQKVVSIGSMVGVALLSMMKMPSMAMLKFKGLFPSMDQARIISTATFASRMAASEDKNDLREATFRDIATFSSFYFLGDYVAKGIATAVQKVKPEIKLINVLEKAPDKDANVFKKFWHWAKHTAIKSSDEVVGKKAMNLRSVCQIGNIVFSLVALGIVIPTLYRKKTGEEREKELKQMGVDQKTINKYYPPFQMNSAEAKKRDVYKAFSTSLQQR